MKKLLPVLLVIACLSFITSCKKSDDKMIIGSWGAKSANSRSYLDGVLNSQQSNELTSNDMTMEFRKSKTYIVYEYGAVSEEGTYSIDGDKLTMNGSTNTFSISRKELNISVVGEQEENGHTIRYEVDLTLEKR